MPNLVIRFCLFITIFALAEVTSEHASAEDAVHCKRPKELGLFEQCEPVKILRRIKGELGNPPRIRFYSRSRHFQGLAPESDIFVIPAGTSGRKRQPVKVGDRVAVAMGIYYQICEVRLNDPLLFRCGPSSLFPDTGTQWFKAISLDQSKK